MCISVGACVELSICVCVRARADVCVVFVWKYLHARQSVNRVLFTHALTLLQMLSDVELSTLSMAKNVPKASGQRFLCKSCLNFSHFSQSQLFCNITFIRSVYISNFS